MSKEKHVNILGWLYICSGLLVLLSAVIVFLGISAGGLFSGDIGAMIASPIAAVVAALIIALFALPGLLVGKGLHDGKSWARVLAMVLGILNVLQFPLGTALCLYTFWVLWGSEVDHIFEPGYAKRYEHYE